MLYGRKEAAADLVTHLQSLHAVLVRARAGTLLGIEVVLSCFACQNLAIFGDLESLAKRFVGFNHDIFVELLLFYYHSQSLWSLHGLLGDFVFYGNQFENPLQPLFEEVEVHVLGPAYEEKVDLDPVSVRKPFRNSLCFEFKVMFAGADLDLYGLELTGLGLGFRDLHFLFLIVLVLAIIHYLCDRWHCHRGDLYQIQFPCASLGKRLFKRNYAKIFAVFGDYPQFGRFYLVIDTYFDQGITGLIYSMNRKSEQAFL